jgi:hypothetical protein
LTAWAPTLTFRDTLQRIANVQVGRYYEAAYDDGTDDGGQGHSFTFRMYVMRARNEFDQQQLDQYLAAIVAEYPCLKTEIDRLDFSSRFVRAEWEKGAMCMLK